MSNVHAGATFGNSLNLSNDPTVSSIPQVASSGSNVYVVWENDTDTSSEILFRASTNDGTSFGATINLSNNAGFSANPQIAAAGGSVYVVWQDDTLGNNEIFFRASTNNGAGFGTSQNLSNENKESTVPQIAASGSNVYVAWQNIPSPGPATQPPDIFFKAITNNGSTLGATQNLSANSGGSDTPQIAASGSNVYVTWRDDTNTNPSNDETFFKVITNNGSTLGATQNLSSNSGTSYLQQIAAAGDNVYVLWQDDTNNALLSFDALVRASSNDGTSFSPSTNLSNSALSIDGRIAATGTSVFIVWQEFVSGNSEVKFRASTNGGAIFGSASNLSNNAGSSASPIVAASGSNVYVAWDDTTANPASEILFQASTDSGAIFTNTQNLSNNSGFSSSPRMAALGTRVFVVWTDDTTGADDILFAAGTSAIVKTTFTLNALFTGWNSTNPSLTVFRGKPFTVMVIWKDSPAHRFAVYTKSFPSLSVSIGDTCNLSNTNGCLAKSSDVTSSNPSTIFTFTPTIPPDDFTGPGTYEYYCQYHPGTMHGTLIVYKSPDIDGDGTVTILDIASVAFYYQQSQPTWASGAVPVDFNNDGKVTILDVAFGAFYFGKTL